MLGDIIADSRATSPGIRNAPLLEHVCGFCRASSRRLIRQAIAKIRP
jgi:hypothetical protein